MDYSNAKGTFVVGLCRWPRRNMLVPVKTGIWFVDMQGNQAVKGLNIPDAPKGWMYAGWMRAEGKPAVKMGRFSSPSVSGRFQGVQPGAITAEFSGRETSCRTRLRDIASSECPWNEHVDNVEPKLMSEAPVFSRTLHQEDRRRSRGGKKR